ncbi:MAG: M20/M25/M40 family metallo-hydrolase [Rikenellaceae bacterium]|nr:M20/M25/M40 family metallo-hydrolase [Rikenellaceae bacterium]
MTVEQAIELLKRLIATPSVSRNESAAADIVEAQMVSMGFKPQRKGNNVWAEAWKRDESKPTILLDAHIDTVRPNAQWVRDPFAPTVEGDRLYGLGSNDTGGSLVAMIAVFSQLATTEQPYNLIMLASAEEEVTGVNGVRAVLPELGKVDFAIVGEPTGMNPAVAEKGLLVLDCVAHGVAGHAAREEGVNAIYKALKDIEWFRTHCFERVSPLLGPVKMTVTGVEAGTQHNVVPAECRFMVDVRVNECYQNVEMVELIREAVECDVTPRSTHLNSSAIALDHPAVVRLVAKGRTPFGSPTMSNQAVMPFTTLKLGPGDSARSHTADEYILISEIVEAVEIYVAVLDKLEIEK